MTINELHKKNIFEHLDDLLVCVRRLAFLLVLGFAVGYVAAPRVIQWFELPLLSQLPPGSNLIFTTPFEKFWIYVRVSLYLGLYLASPFAAVAIGKFVGPALHLTEKKRFRFLLLVLAFFFNVGLWLGHRFVLPAVIHAILSFGNGSEQPLFSVYAYVNAAVGIIVATGVFVLLPIVMGFLSSWGWVEARIWSKGRKYSIVINAIISAILSPPDGLSMLAMMVPLHLLYESGILISLVAEWARGKRSEKKFITNASV